MNARGVGRGGQSSIQFPSFDNHLHHHLPPHHTNTNTNNTSSSSSSSSFPPSQSPYHHPMHQPQPQPQHGPQHGPYSHPMLSHPNPSLSSNLNLDSGTGTGTGGFPPPPPPPLGHHPLPPQMGMGVGMGMGMSTMGGHSGFGGRIGGFSQVVSAASAGGYRSDYAGNEVQVQPQGGGAGGASGGGGGASGDGGGGGGGGQMHLQGQPSHSNGIISPAPGPQGQAQTGYQAFGAAAVSPSYHHPNQQQANGYRSPSLASPGHQHVAPNHPNAQAQLQGQAQSTGGHDFPISASSVTPEQAARYGIAGLGTPLGSAGIGAWMDGVNAAGMKSAGTGGASAGAGAGAGAGGGAGAGAGTGGNWLEASPLQQQQQQAIQSGQAVRRSFGERDGGVSPGLGNGLASPGLNGAGGSGAAASGGPFGRDSRAGNGVQHSTRGEGNWTGFSGNSTRGEQGRGAGQQQQQLQQQQQQQQAGLGAKAQGSRGSGSGGSVQGQTQSRPSSVGQQRQVSQAPPQQQVGQQQQSDETVHGNNAGDANAERMIGKLVDDEVIPTAIVIKNIPFAVQKETLLAIIESLQAPLPYAFNYHHDNGVFRGLAFANFRHPHEADAVVVALNGYDISGRKLRVEYKKVLQAGEKERIEREKAIKRMRSMQFDRGQLPTGGGANGSSSGNPSRSASGAYINGGGPNRQGSWSQTNANSGSNANANSQSGNQQNALSGIPASLLASMTPQQLQSLAASLPGGGQSLNFSQQGQSLTPPLTTQSQSSSSGGMVSHLSHVHVPQHVTGALIRERTESTNTTGSQTVQRDNKSGQDSAFGAGSMQAMQQHHLQQLQNPDRMPSPALSLGGASHHGSSNGGNGGLSPSLGPNAFAQSQPMQITASNPGSQAGYNDVDFNDPVVLDIFSRALMFKEDRMRDEFSFSRNLSVKDRRAVHAVGEKLGLHHYSTGEGSDRYVVLSKVDPSRNNPSKVLSRQTGRVQSMAAQQGSYLSPYSPPIESAESRPESPGLRIKKSMPNMSLLNGPTVSRDPHRLLNKRSSGNLRDYATVGSGQQSRRPFASHTGATGSSSFNNLFGNALGNGTFEQSASSPTSPTDPTLATQGANLPGLPGGFVRQPLGPTTENKGFISRTQLRSQTSTPPAGSIAPTTSSTGNMPSSSGSLKNGVIGGQRALTGSSGKGDNQSTHTSGSSTIEEEDFSDPKTSPTDRSTGQA